MPAPSARGLAEALAKAEDLFGSIGIIGILVLHVVKLYFFKKLAKKCGFCYNEANWSYNAIIPEAPAMRKHCEVSPTKYLMLAE